MSAWTCRHTDGKVVQKIVPPRPRIPWWKGPGADSEEKQEPASDIDTALVDSLKVLDPKGPIREADVLQRWTRQPVRSPLSQLHLLAVRPRLSERNPLADLIARNRVSGDIELSVNRISLTNGFGRS